MKKSVFLLCLIYSPVVLGAMGYLGGYPYTVNTDIRRQDFNVAPLPPAPDRRVQYETMGTEKETVQNDLQFGFENESISESSSDIEFVQKDDIPILDEKPIAEEDTFEEDFLDLNSEETTPEKDDDFIDFSEF
ncbi:MAG: hypothetical protein JXR30_03225 [Alphaproteobacteria bacterium]|nr:hypothetical protein [Alphaproteobacteria bacterium]